MNESKHTAEVRELKRVNADLLSVCEAIVEFHASNYDSLLGVSDSLVRELNQCVTLARAAIAKAKGGAA